MRASGVCAWVRMHGCTCTQVIAGGGVGVEGDVDMQVPELGAMLTCGAWSCLQDGDTAMIKAAIYGRAEVVDRLLAAGADRDAQDRVLGCV